MNTDKIIIAVIIVVVLYAHWWIFKWVKFKVDEAVIIKYLQQNLGDEIMNIQTVAAATELSNQRVIKICRKSQSDQIKKLNQIVQAIACHD